MLPNNYLRHHKKIVWVLLVISIIFLLLSPLDEVRDKISQTAPTLLLSILVSEAAFILGILIMASSIGFELGKNPLTWKRHIHEITKELPDNKMFWFGFWVNAAGAFGTGIFLSIGIIRVFPVQSWGLLWIAFADIALTLTVRAAILELRTEYKN